MLRKLLLITSLCLLSSGTAQPLFKPLNAKCTPVPPEKACRYLAINSSLLLKNDKPVPYNQLPPISLNVWTSTAREVAYWNVVLSSNGSLSRPISIPGGWKWIGRFASTEDSIFWLVYRNGVWSGVFATRAVEYRVSQVRGALRVEVFRPPLPGVLPYLIVPPPSSGSGAAP